MPGGITHWLWLSVCLLDAVLNRLLAFAWNSRIGLKRMPDAAQAFSANIGRILIV